MEDVYLLIVHGEPTRDQPDGNYDAVRFVTDIDAVTSTLDQGTYTVMSGKRENAGDVPKQLKPFKKFRRKPKAEAPDPYETEVIT